MPVILECVLSIFIGLGFYFFGNFLSTRLNLLSTIKVVSNPHYQFPIIGISFFLFFLFPIFLSGFLDKNIFQFFFYLLAIFGLVKSLLNINNVYLFVNRNIRKKMNISLKELFIYILLILYFLVSISVVTSGDSLSYHLGVAKYINSNGIFPTEEMDFHGKLAGIGEFLNAFAISVNAEQFTSLIHFLGLASTIGIIKEFSSKQKLNNTNICFVILLVLSCPSLISLISQSKPQLFYGSIVFFSYSCLLALLNEKKNSLKNFYKIVLVSNIFLTIAVNAKLNFILSFFIINLFYFYFLLKLKDKISLKFIICYFLLILYGLLPFPMWKSFSYNYPFYLFFINPLPLNIPHYVDFFNFLKNYQTEKFPWIIIFPSSLKDFTDTLGIGCLSILFIIKYQWKNKIILLALILFFIFILILVGQKTSRFYYEIYLLIILIFLHILPKIEKTNIFLCFKFLIYFQSLLVSLALLFSAFYIFPGNFSHYYKDKVLTNFADGYSIIKWANSVLPRKETVIVTQRSTSLFENNYINAEPLGYMYYDSVFKDYYLNQIKEKKPKFIIFYGGDEVFKLGNFDFKQCTDKLFAKKENVGFLATRNPLNSDKKYYNGYIYNFDSEKLPECVKPN